MRQLEQLMREAALMLCLENDPPPETVSAAMTLAAEVLRLALTSLSASSPDDEDGDDELVSMPLSPQTALETADRTAEVLTLVMRIMPLVEDQLYALDDELLYAAPERVGESGQRRGFALARQATTALHAIEQELANGLAPQLLPKVYQLRNVEIRKEA